MICVLYARNSACAYIIKRDIKHAHTHTHTHTHTFHYTRVLLKKVGRKDNFSIAGWLFIERLGTAGKGTSTDHVQHHRQALASTY